MEASHSVIETRRRTNDTAREERARLLALPSVLDGIRAQALWSDSEKENQATIALIERGAAFRGAVAEDARAGIAFARGGAERRLEKAREVAPEELAGRRQALAPFLQRAFDDPDVIFKLYREISVQDPAVRRVLEDHADYLAIAGDATAGLDGLDFAQRFGALQEDLVPQRSEEERQALADIAALDGVEGYRAAVAALGEIDLATLQNGGVVPEGQFATRATLEGQINNYEREHGLPWSNPLAAGQQADPFEEV